VARPPQISKEEIRKELLKCGRDPVYFIKNYIKISHPLKGVIPFSLYNYQEDCVKSFNDYRFNIILKARQLGMSTTIAAYCVWLMNFHRSKEIMVVATKFQKAANLVKKVKAMIKKLPAWIRIAEVEINNETNFQLSNESKILASTTSEDAGRSEALSLLIVDEAAHVEKLSEMWKAVYPTLSTGGRCIMLSTPNGTGNLFHQLYSGAEQKSNDFNPVMLLWDVHPERDQEWFEKETRNMSSKDIAQELLCSFLMSGETVFAPESIEEYRKSVIDPKYKTGFDRNLWIWEEYQQGSPYLLIADTARGDGQDYSTFHIFKLDTMEIAAEYQGKPPIDMFANMLNQVGREYGNCLLAVENNSIGIATLQELISLEYPNLYWSAKTSHEYVVQYQAENRSDCVPGFTMSPKTRPQVIAKLEEYIRNKIITIYSIRLIEEMKTFIWNNGRAEAMRGYNDDLILACAIGCWIRETALNINTRDLEYKKAFLSCIRKSNTIIDTSIIGMERKAPGLQEQIEIAKQFPWIFKG
jgi:hypothetical protein